MSLPHFLLGALLACLGLCARAAEPTHLVLPNAPMCPERAALERILQRQAEHPGEALAVSAQQVDAVCQSVERYSRVTDLIPVANGSLSYACFRLWDATRSEAPAQTEAEFCAPQANVSTLDHVLAERTGAFHISHREQEGDFEFVRAECAEAGSVTAQRKGKGWMRRSTLPFDVPHKAGDDALMVQGQLEDALREGCKGEDLIKGGV